MRYDFQRFTVQVFELRGAEFSTHIVWVGEVLKLSYDFSDTRTLHFVRNARVCLTSPQSAKTMALENMLSGKTVIEELGKLRTWLHMDGEGKPPEEIYGVVVVNKVNFTPERPQ